MACISAGTGAGEGNEEDVRFEAIRFDTVDIVLHSGMWHCVVWYYPPTRWRGKLWVELVDSDHSTIHLATHCSSAYQSDDKIWAINMAMFSACIVHVGGPWLIVSTFHVGGWRISMFVWGSCYFHLQDKRFGRFPEKFVLIYQRTGCHIPRQSSI